MPRIFVYHISFILSLFPVSSFRNITLSFISFLFIAFLFFLFPVYSTHASPLTPFPVFDGMFYNNKPDLSEFGMSHINLIYSVKFWNYRQERNEPNTDRIIAVANKLDPNTILCIDIEDWPVTGNKTIIKDSINKYTTVASLIRKTNPDIKFGFYGVLPIRDYWRAIGAKGATRFRNWQQENLQISQLADFVDYIFPSLYTFYEDKDGWVKYAIANIREARKYRKPVFVFLWPKYHESSSLSNEYISASFWRLQLETCFKYADGIVIWGGHDEIWDDTAPWWLETKSFLSSHNILSVN